MTAREVSARVSGRVGRRGLALIFLGLVDISLGYGLLTIDDYGPAIRVAYAGQTLLAPLNVWMAAWFAVGAISFVQAFMKSDRLAFALSGTLKLGWSCGFVVAFLFLNSPRGWLSAVIYAAFAAFVLMISGWEENHPPIIIESAPKDSDST